MEGAPVRLTQTDDTTVGTALSLACADSNGTYENSWYRVFPLVDDGIREPFYINRVNFGVQTAVGKQRVKVSVGTYAGDAGAEQLQLGLIDVLGLTTVEVDPVSTRDRRRAPGQLRRSSDPVRLQAGRRGEDRRLQLDQRQLLLSGRDESP